MARYYSRYQVIDITKRAMKSRGFTQRSLADSMGISQALISKALSGGNPGVLCKIYVELTGRSIERDFFRVD